MRNEQVCSRLLLLGVHVCAASAIGIHCRFDTVNMQVRTSLAPLYTQRSLSTISATALPLSFITC